MYVQLCYLEERATHESLTNGPSRTFLEFESEYDVACLFTPAIFVKPFLMLVSSEVC